MGPRHVPAKVVQSAADIRVDCRVIIFNVIGSQEAPSSIETFIKVRLWSIRCS